MIELEDIMQRCRSRVVVADLTVLYQTAMEIKPKSIVEIGAEFGCSSMVLGTVAREHDGCLYSIDPTRKPQWYENIKQLELEEYAIPVEEFSPWVPLDKITIPIDYLFIDGHHLTKWCIVDYHYWEHFVRPGGRIAFHDYAGNIWGKQVRRAIEIILETDPLVEIAKVETPGQGLIVFGKSQQEVVK